MPVACGPSCSSRIRPVSPKKANGLNGTGNLLDAGNRGPSVGKAFCVNLVLVGVRFVLDYDPFTVHSM